MRAILEMYQYRCDGCDRIVATELGDELPYGYHGTVTHIDDGGGSGGDFWACSDRCVVRALKSASAG